MTLKCIFLVLAVVTFAGCAIDEEEKKAQESIDFAAHEQWEYGVDAGILLHAKKFCEQKKRNNCEIIGRRFVQVANAVATCRINTSEPICRDLNAVALGQEFVGGKADSWPTHPFYWRLPNDLLQAWAEDYAIRDRVYSIWYDKWEVELLAAAIALVAIFAIFAWKRLGPVMREISQKRAREADEYMQSGAEPECADETQLAAAADQQAREDAHAAATAFADAEKRKKELAEMEIEKQIFERKESERARTNALMAEAIEAAKDAWKQRPKELRR